MIIPLILISQIQLGWARIYLTSSSICFLFSLAALSIVCVYPRINCQGYYRASADKRS